MPAQLSSNESISWLLAVSSRGWGVGEREHALSGVSSCKGTNLVTTLMTTTKSYRVLGFQHMNLGGRDGKDIIQCIIVLK